MLNNEEDEIVWDTLTFVIGHIVYGGRVTDDHDRTCIMNILDSYITPEIIMDEYKFDLNCINTPPASGSSMADYLKYISELPENDPAELFGMNQNAEIAYQLQESNSMIATILSIQPQTGGSGGGKNSDEIIDTFAAQILEGLPELLTREGSNKELFKQNKMGLMASHTTFLLQEMERFNALVVQIRRTLKELRNAIVGLAVMNEDLDSMYKSMLINQVPDIWAEIAYPSLKPLGTWIDNLQERVLFIRGWL